MSVSGGSEYVSASKDDMHEREEYTNTKHYMLYLSKVDLRHEVLRHCAEGVLLVVQTHKAILDRKEGG
jgi:hypothetical protein